MPKPTAVTGIGLAVSATQVLHRQTLEFRQRLAGGLQIGNRKSRDFRRRE